MARYPAVPRGPASRLKGGALPPLLHTAMPPLRLMGVALGIAACCCATSFEIISQACLSCRASSLYFKQASR